MSKSSKASKKKKVKEPIIEEIETPPDTSLWKKIYIKLNKISPIHPEHPISDTYIEIRHENEIITQSIPKIITEQEAVFAWEYAWVYNLDEDRELDRLLTHPLYFTVWQDVHVAPSLITESTITRDAASEESLYEPILGVKDPELLNPREPEVKIKEKKPKKNKSKDKSKDSKGSKGSEKGKSKGSKSKLSKKSNVSAKSDKSSKNKKSLKPIEEGPPPILVGNGTLDLSPLFLGETSFTTECVIYQDEIYMDYKMIPYLTLPRLVVTISLEQPLWTEFRKPESLFNFTVVSMYNLPKEYANYDCKLATIFPTYTPGITPVCFENGVYKDEPEYWPNFKKYATLSHLNDFSARTTEKISETLDDIKHQPSIDISFIFEKETPRTQWFLHRRTWLTEDGAEFLKNMFIRYRVWPIELYLTEKMIKLDKPDKKKKKDKKSEKESKTSSKGSKTSKKSKKGRELEPIHLMGFIDISNLIYPGVTKTRVVCPIQTFEKTELLEKSCLEKSYFLIEEEIIPEVPEKKGKKGKGDDKKSNKSDKGSKETKKGKKDKKGKVKTVPEEPIIEIDPSVPVVDENDELTFIVIEVELTKALTPRRTIEDLTDEIFQLIPRRPKLPKTVNTSNLAVQIYHETLKKLSLEINIEYQKYLEFIGPTKADTITPIQFVVHLQKEGIYHNHFSTMLESVARLINDKYRFTDSNPQNHKIYERYMADVYVSLVDIMHEQINSLASCQNPKCEFGKTITVTQKLFWIIEAVELNAPGLAERYIVEGLSKLSTNADYWLQYAIYYRCVKFYERAFECVKETLAIQHDHIYGLLLYATIMFEEDEFYLCETALLKLTYHHPSFAGGWVCLLVFYHIRRKFEGTDYVLDKIKKLDVTKQRNDYIYNFDGMAWTAALGPQDCPYFETCVILIKLKTLKFAEHVLHYAKLKDLGLYQYYRGVILYFLGDFEHAVVHLTDAQKLHGPDYAVNSLLGHCLYKMNMFDKAKELYEFVMQSFNRPDNMHLVQIRLSYLYEKENNLIEARKYILYVVKYSATPYAWLLLGILYYKLDNLVAAEDCLQESNLLDNCLPETWAYLCLCNLKKGHTWEADQCFTLMKKYGLKNEEIYNQVLEKMRAANLIK